MKKLLLIIILSINLLHKNKIIAQVITLGTQVTQSGTSGISPYNYFYESRRVQFVYTRTEIIAAGGSAGLITAIAWDVSQVTGGNLSNYTIRMAHTSASDASSHNAASLTTVKNAHTLTPGATGFRTITFDSNFCWNGSDNILVDVCWGVNGGFASNGQVWMYNNVANQTRGVNSSTTSQCGNNTTTARNYKPRAQFTISPITLPIATFTKICAPDYQSYSLSIQITSLGSFTSVDITDGVTTYQSNVGLGTYTITGLTGSKTISIIQHGGGSCGYQQSFTACDICTSPTLPANECVGAPTIDLSQPFAGSTNCAYTASAGSPSVCGMTIENDSWISFIAGSTTVELEFEVGDCSSNNGIQLSVFGGTCGALSLIAGSCVNPTGENTTGNWTFSGLSIGARYYIRIDGYAGDLCNYWFTPISGVVIVPSNDLCANAITLSCGQTNVASNILATATDAPAACTGGGTTSKGVWYRFVGSGSNVTVSTNNPQTNFATNINIYTGTCGSLTCVTGASPSSGSTSITLSTTNGTIYYIYVDGDGAAQGTFEISLTCPPCPANAGTWD